MALLEKPWRISRAVSISRSVRRASNRPRMVARSLAITSVAGASGGMSWTCLRMAASTQSRTHSSRPYS
ncbi:hypothetical protein D3C85_1586100 [compost metagenome]